MIKIDTHKIEHQPKNTLIWDNSPYRKQSKSIMQSISQLHNAVYFSTNLILNDEIEKN
jgi:hypothetical protein